ncbi:MAG: CBS domain-containing protein [Thermotogaceae bacterium]|nr:CBS domain-containing protein [Thermotogota bacterium]NLZ13591.1 CBS domain-containing protein [Thermotogaceae bacterium]HPH10251.1 CBS domain-containing protein [Thermotogota bacterium]HQN22401.1 CBS domain-containing protein [Thermotogota bacterium]HQQ65860.1 CBS domain-containing protein [Thermotogota bacterium]
MKPTVDKLIDQMQMLFKDLVAKDLMAPNVISISPDRTMEQAKELMRLKKISGLPVVENDILVGLVSIEDIIKALERHTIHDPIYKIMTKNLIVVSPDENLPQIFDKFTRTGFGRFPVVDNQKRLVGILTKEDILRGILEEFRLLYVRDKRRQDVIDGEALNRSLITGEEINKLGADFAFSIDYVEISLSGIGAARLKEFLKGRGIEEEIARKVAIATYEAETNVVIHSGSSGNIYCFIYPEYVRVRVEDHGKGIEDLDKAMQEGYSTATDQIREMGFGAGMGISNMHRYSDKMVIVSEIGKGVIVEMQFFLKDTANGS